MFRAIERSIESVKKGGGPFGSVIVKNKKIISYGVTNFNGRPHEEAIALNKNKHNICVIGCLNGKCNIYLYNPKHVDYLDNKNNKKWAIQVNLLNNNLLYIPSNWFYNIETEEECILFHIDADNYFTSIYNEYRE